MTSDPRTVPAALDRFARQLPDHAALITDDRSLHRRRHCATRYTARPPR